MKFLLLSSEPVFDISVQWNISLVMILLFFYISLVTSDNMVLSELIFNKKYRIKQKKNAHTDF